MQELVACSSCGRKFASDRVDKHMSICAKEGLYVNGRSRHPSVPTMEPAEQGTIGKGAEPVLDELQNLELRGCQFCQRRFRLDRIEKHEDVCRNARTMSCVSSKATSSAATTAATAATAVAKLSLSSSSGGSAAKASSSTGAGNGSSSGASGCSASGAAVGALASRSQIYRWRLN